MEELLRFLITRSMFLFTLRGFRIVDSRTFGSSGDALIVLESASMRLRLVRDSAQMHLQVQPNQTDLDEWFGIGIARRWIVGERPGSDALDDQSVEFLHDQMDRLEAEFASAEGRDLAVARMRSEKRARAREMSKAPPPG